LHFTWEQLLNPVDKLSVFPYGEASENEGNVFPMLSIPLSFVQMKVSELKVGQKARILSVESGELGRRLMEMGFIPGKTVQLTGKGPFGSPLAFRVDFLHAALRNAEAELIEIENIESEIR
jgi:ferrous iron transport protein A